MAVASGLSVSSHPGDSAVLQQPRSSWALSWPLAVGLVLFVWLPNSKGLLADPDRHWHVTVGNWILAHGAVPTVDVYSFAFALMMRLLLRDIRPLPALLFTVAAAVMTAPHLLARPHVLAFPVMLIWVSGLVRAVEERRAPRPVLLLAMLAWANLHGGFT